MQRNSSDDRRVAGHRANVGGDYEIFDQWVEILPTDQIVPVEVQYDGHYVRLGFACAHRHINAGVEQRRLDGFADAGFLTLGIDYFRGVRPSSCGRA